MRYFFSRVAFRLITSAFFVLPVHCFASETRDMGMAEVILAAEKVDPDLKAAQSRESQAMESVEIAKAPYYPTMDFEAIDTYGFPGSSGRALQVDGLVGSPFRSGPADGLVSKMTIFDLGREYGLSFSRYKLLSARERKRIARLALDQEVLRGFFQASQYRSQLQTWVRMEKETEKVAKLVERFTSNGRHSVVSLMLVQDQNRIAKISQSDYETRYQMALKHMALLTGIHDKELSFPLLSDLNENTLTVIKPGGLSPLITHAQAEAQAAHAQVLIYQAKNLPKILAVASLGGMDQSRLVQKQDYSGGFGFLLPIFEGNRITGEIKRAKHFAEEKENDLLSAQLHLDEINVRYDASIEASRKELSMLEEEDAAAIEVLDRSKKRYLAFIGQLVDVREALRNLARIETQMNERKTELLSALGDKALINGGAVIQ